MRQNRKVTIVVLSVLLSSFVLQGCGQNKATENHTGSFSDVASAVATTSAMAAPIKIPTEAPIEAPIEASTAAPIEETTLAAASETKEHVATDQVQAQAQEKTVELPDKAEKEVIKPAKEKETGSKQEAEAKTTYSPDQPTKQQKKDITKISWSGFFDGEDQTTPSDQFWDLSGSTVKIRGFMGEVLSFEKNWFLLIPEPGAECPFDNGDETYWNKIMIVFVPQEVQLRYKSEAIEITGRLDVGIKVDESGYKTMFRLYDATFTEIKE